ncbi:glycosyltransferase [Candidatus Gottesmanbacteria bacterium]|nr:glycosyltransferase [Candidatus Gottesmanbacteria bacterium]
MSVYLYNLSNNLAQLGSPVDIFTRAHREKDERILTIHKNVRVIHLLSESANDHRRGVWTFSKRMLQFISEKKLDYDIFHAHYFYSGLIGIEVSRKLDIPFVQTFHTLGIMKERYGGISSVGRKHDEKLITADANGIITSTPFEKNDLQTFYHADPGKLHIVSPGVNHNVFHPHNKSFSRTKLGLPKAKKTILFVGRIDPIKGLQLLIEAVSILSGKYPHFQKNFRVLLIGGDIASQVFWQHPEVKKIKQLIVKKEIECCVKFLGSRPHSLLPFYYSASDVTVMPSVYESFGLVALEAMASGACVLASRVGGLRYLVKDGVNGRLFENGDSLDLAQKLWELLQDSKKRTQFGENALKSSQAFCWDKQAAKIQSIYKTLL